MQIIQTYRFLLDLEEIANFISLGSIKQANLFLDNLEKSLENLYPVMIKIYRDLIFKVYVK
ncbi:hypothetical protein OLP40_07960 [Campylobacter jejuni]|nr:plasmid stabilization system [Campylobacter jejuni subsp. jejuni 414]MCW1334073.1 hypothetical protein [Campylobacter jejuni]MCW1358944.1 hypothetical protein [Campylobacter jejuni]HDZ4932744.1 hypothetical protein [Campylobacter jejuni]HDZ4937204.1 hypothetical protein [Campylobacter jejuni]